MDGRIFIRKYPCATRLTLYVNTRASIGARLRDFAFVPYVQIVFFQTISKLDPKFIALHCQEVGGKNYEQSMRHVEDFVR